MNIISLGTTACEIAEKFKQYQQYKVYQIDTLEREKNRYYLKIPKKDKPYEYEQNAPIKKIEKFFKGIRGEIIFIVCGCEIISSLSLVILEQLNKISQPTVLYIRPDLMFVGKEKKDFEKIVFQYFQEYARRDFIKQLYLFDNLMVEKVIEDINLSNYSDKVNDIISWFVYSINYYNNQSPIFDNFNDNEQYGIVTIGINKFGEESDEKLFYSLDKIREKRYYYIINEEQLKNNNKFLNEIREDIKEKIKDDDKVLYGVYPSELKDNMIVSVNISTTIQR